MSKNNDNKISFPVVKDSKDICRIIFQKSEFGKYDIKLEFLDNPYQISIYKLFNKNPEIINVEDFKTTNISYHSGSKDRQVIIHLKNTANTNEKYCTLPMYRIQAPNVNQKIPVPLFRIEVPKNVINNSRNYKSKKYHHVLDVENDNTFEFYIASSDFSFESYDQGYLSEILFPQLVLSIEFFATNTVVSDKYKYKYYLPKHGAEKRHECFMGINGMKLLVGRYNNLELDIDCLNVTFLENELSTEILYNASISYPNVEKNGEYPCVYVGGSELKKLNTNLIRYCNYKIANNTAVSKILRSKNVNPQLKLILAKKASVYRQRLVKELKQHNRRNESINHP